MTTKAVAEYELARKARPPAGRGHWSPMQVSRLLAA
jgi:hypothetical protein